MSATIKTTPIRKKPGLPIVEDQCCEHCHKNPGPDPRNNSQWFGFLDLDTGQYCCRACIHVHYRRKAHTEHAHKFSEIPVLLKEVPV